MFVYIYWLDQYTDALQHFIATKLVLAPLLLLFLEEAGVPLIVPGDVIIAYTGYKLSLTNTAELWQAFIAAQISVMLGATILFFIARRWGQWLITAMARFVFLEQKHIQRAERLFAKYGVLGIIVGRHIPGLRIAITVFAATSGVKYPTFIVSTFISTSIWILFFLSVGKRVGANFHQEFQHYIGISAAVVATVTVSLFVLHGIGMYREGRKKQRVYANKTSRNRRPK